MEGCVQFWGNIWFFFFLALVDAESGAFVDIELNNVCAEINDLVAALCGQKAYISEFVEVDESDVLISFLKHTGEIIMLTN